MKYIYQQFKNSEKLINLISIFKGRLESLLDFVTQVNNLERSSAEGENLDFIASYVGEKRKGRNDLDLNDAISLKIFVNHIKPTIPNLHFAIKWITGATKVQIIPVFPAALVINVIDGDNLNILQASKEEIVSAGTSILFTSQTENPFVFDGDSEGEGFADSFDLDAYGGRFVSLI